MSEVKELEARIEKLPQRDFRKLREWFFDLDNEQWDEQIASDFKAGKFKKLIDKARAEFADGKAREL